MDHPSPPGLAISAEGEEMRSRIPRGACGSDARPASPPYRFRPWLRRRRSRPSPPSSTVLRYGKGEKPLIRRPSNRGRSPRRPTPQRATSSSTTRRCPSERGPSPPAPFGIGARRAALDNPQRRMQRRTTSSNPYNPQRGVASDQASLAVLILHNPRRSRKLGSKRSASPNQGLRDLRGTKLADSL